MAQGSEMTSQSKTEFENLEQEIQAGGAAERSPDSILKKPENPAGVLYERYRCPEELVKLSFVEPPAGKAGFFRFGPAAVCYGRTQSGEQGANAEIDGDFHDAMEDVTADGVRPRLPFNPSEVIENLRLERYARNGDAGSRSNRLLKDLYYLVRPFVNLSVRRGVQKFHARNWKKQVFPRWPVETSVEDLCEAMLLMAMQATRLERVPFIWFWPDGAEGCVAMTHDVETEAGRDHCSKLMDLDDSFGIKAAFGIVPEERYEVPTDLIQTIWRRGFEVTVQDLNHDGRLFDDKEKFLQRATKINRYGQQFGAKGFRAGVLYRKPEWYYALDFAYDTSVPNVAPLDPQRGGCCTVMPFFIGELLEIPVTTTQDYTLLNVLGETSIDLWKRQMDRILLKKGLASFIVHPDYILEPDHLSVYRELLDYLKTLREKTRLWFALPSEINEWWRARNNMCLVPDGQGWRVEGEGSDRALLAYATNVDGRLVYELSRMGQ